MNDLAVATNGAVEALQVAVDNEVEVVEAFVGSPLQGSTALNFIHLTVAEKRPDLLVVRVFDAAVGQVAIRLRLEDCVDRTEAHRHGRELPELGHEARVRIARESVRCPRFLLPKAIQLVFAEASFEEGAGVHSRGRVPLVENLVAATRVVLAAEKVVVSNLIEGCGTGVGRDVATDSDARSLRAVHRDCGVPTNPRAVLALNLFVAWKGWLVLWSDGVEVVGGRHHRHTEVQLF